MGAAEKAQHLKCFGKEPGFDSQHPQGGSQPPVTSVLKDSIHVSVLQGHQGLTQCIDLHEDKTPIYIKDISE